jgi:hypothetical protein
MEWLPATSTTSDPARRDMARWAAGGIIRSSVVTMYQLGFVRQAGSVTCPAGASTAQGTCESAMNAARSAGRSAANEAWNLSRSRNRKPSLGGRMGGCGPSAGNPPMSELTDSSLSGANAQT